MTPSQHDGKPVGHIKFGEHVEFDDHDQRESREGEIGRERPHRTADYPSNQNRKGRESNQFPRKHHFPRPIRDGRNEHDYGNHTDEHHPLQVGVERTLREGNEEDSDNSPTQQGVRSTVPEQPLDVLIGDRGDDSLSIIMGEMWESQIRVRTDTERSATGDSNRQLSLLVEGVIELFTGHNFNRDASNLPVNRSDTDLLLRSSAFGASPGKARPSPEAGGFWLAARNL